jgi:hypothetical protein
MMSRAIKRRVCCGLESALPARIYVLPFARAVPSDGRCLLIANLQVLDFRYVTSVSIGSLVVAVTKAGAGWASDLATDLRRANPPRGPSFRGVVGCSEVIVRQPCTGSVAQASMRRNTGSLIDGGQGSSQKSWPGSVFSASNSP